MITTDVLLYSYQCLDDFSKGHQSNFVPSFWSIWPDAIPVHFFSYPVHSSNQSILHISSTDIAMCLYFAEASGIPAPVARHPEPASALRTPPG